MNERKGIVGVQHDYAFVTQRNGVVQLRQRRRGRKPPFVVGVVVLPEAFVAALSSFATAIRFLQLGPPRLFGEFPRFRAFGL